MGFYGHISNIQKTSMTFDRIYSNRTAMDKAVAGDGVYAGRYVLVEYGYNGGYKRLYKLTVDGTDRFYASRTLTENTRVEFSSVPTDDENSVVQNEIVFILNKDLEQEFYICVGADENNKYAVFELLAEEEQPADAGTYFDNYYKDIQISE